MKRVRSGFQPLDLPFFFLLVVFSVLAFLVAPGLGCVLGWSRALSLSVLVWATLRRTCRCCFLLRLVPRKTHSHCHTLVILTVERRICCSRFYHMQFLLFPRWPLRHARGFTLLWPVAKCGSSMSWRCRSSSFGWTRVFAAVLVGSCVGEELSDFVHGGVLASFRLDFAKCLFSSILVHNGKFNFTQATDCEVRGVSWGPPVPPSPLPPSPTRLEQERRVLEPGPGSPTTPGPAEPDWLAVPARARWWCTEDTLRGDVVQSDDVAWHKRWWTRQEKSRQVEWLHHSGGCTSTLAAAFP